MKYRPEIDGLRAIAVLSVVFYHAQLQVLGRLAVPGGFLGVDVFFVISGYLISSIILKELNDGRFSLTHFYERRARRILPALFVVMLATLPFSWFLMLPEAFVHHAKSLIFSLFFASNFWFWQGESYWDAPSALMPLLHTWSLSVEEQFYLFIPLLFIALRSRTQRLMAMSLGALLAISLIVAQVSNTTAPQSGFFLLPARGWELLIGGLLALFQSSRADRAPTNSSIIANYRVILASFGLLLVFASIFSFNEATPHPSLITTLPVIGTVMVIAYSGSDNLTKKLLSWRPLVWVGLISYSLYLWHFPIFSFLKIAGLDSLPAAPLMAIAASLAISVASYRYIEQPFRNKQQIATKQVLIILAVVFATLLASSAAVIHSSGYRARFADFDSLINYGAYQFEAPYLSHRCFLHPEDMIADKQFADCAYSSFHSGDKPTLLLWGDSTAAALIPGFRKTFSERYNLVIRASSGCGAFIKVEEPKRPGCREINDATFADIIEHQPDKVVISGWWQEKFGHENKLQGTLHSLEAAGFKNVTILGSVPNWSQSLPQILITHQKNNPRARKLPAYLPDGLQPVTRAMDQKIAKLAHSFGYEFVSLMNILCEESTGCMTSADGVTPLQWDGFHLTENGSNFVAETLQERL